ncbi:hypothetical protein [Methylobacterium sp. J-048]|uniref:hypothetical protein n=1 Tax=Methylobacterium sp. J-048 TaxID=2836635 RepID=UPI001FB98A83|nr:hypothetical protein [Methylobacterium sp. J-048]
MPLDHAAGATAWRWPDRVQKNFIDRDASGWSSIQVNQSSVSDFVGMLRCLPLNPLKCGSSSVRTTQALQSTARNR